MNAHNPASFVEQFPERHRFTVADARLMVETGVIDADLQFEILDGEILNMPSEGGPHINFKVELNRFFARALPDELRVAPDATLHLAPTDGPEPDLYVFETGATLEPIEAPRLRLVVEIASSSLGYDLGRKASKYAQYGVHEYWVVDINARRTHVLRKPDDGAYHEITAVAFDAELVPERIPGIRLTISALPNLD